MPKLPFIDFTVQPSLTSIALNNNQTSPLTLFQINSSSIKSAIIEYSIQRNSQNEVGWFLVTTDGTTLSYENHRTNNADTGVSLSATLSGSLVLIQYTSTNTGFTGTFKYLQITLT